MSYRHQQFETDNGTFMKLSHEQSLPNDIIRLNPLGRIFFYTNNPLPETETSLYLPDADEIARFGNLDTGPEPVESSVFCESDTEAFINRVSKIGHQIMVATKLHSIHTRGVADLSLDHQQILIDINQQLQAKKEEIKSEPPTGLYL